MCDRLGLLDEFGAAACWCLYLDEVREGCVPPSRHPRAQEVQEEREEGRVERRVGQDVALPGAYLASSPAPAPHVRLDQLGALRTMARKAPGIEGSVMAPREVTAAGSRVSEK